MCKKFIGNEPFAVLLGDDIVYGKKPCLKQLIEAYEVYKTTILGVQTVNTNEISKYGIIQGEYIKESIFKVNSLIEKPSIKNAPSNIAILGRYIITPTIFDILENVPPGLGGEIQLTDALKELSKAESLFAIAFEGTRYDVGDKLGFLQATIDFALRREDLREEFLSYLFKILKKEREILVK